MRTEKTNTLAEIKELTDIYTQCIHCGMCLSSCPTYQLTGLETSSPRGRIKLIRSVAEGLLPVTDTFAYEMNFCLDCQACETACPAGVIYGKMVETARAEIENQGYGSFIKSFFLRKILPYKERIRYAARILRIYQKTGLQKFLRSSGILQYISGKLARVDLLSPVISDEFSDTHIKEISSPEGQEKFKLAFSYGCLMNVFFSDVNRDTVELLNKLNSTVISPADQTCCGSLNAHNGDMKTARELALKNIKAFGKFDYDYLISNSAGCGAFMKEYGELLKDNREYADSAKQFSAKVKDLTEFLSSVQLPLKNVNINDQVTYHDACHLVHTQKIYRQPRELLSQIPGLKYIPLEDSTTCCGSAGIYNIVHPDTADELLKMKIEKINDTNAGIVLTGNPGCMLQIAYGANKFNKKIEVLHPATFFNKML